MSILKLRGMLPALLAAAGLAVAMPGTAQAQGGVSLVPWAGAYIPTRNSIGDLDNALERDVSVMGGARLTFWGTGIFGFEATGGYAPARIADETINETRNTNLFAASGRVLLALSPITNPVGVYIGAGPALLTRGRSVFNEGRSDTEAQGGGWEPEALALRCRQVTAALTRSAVKGPRLPDVPLRPRSGVTRWPTP